MITSLPILFGEHIEISSTLFETLKKIVERIFTVTQSAPYKTALDELYFGGESPFPKEQQKIFREFLDNQKKEDGDSVPKFASFDFHIGGEDDLPKLIEFSYFPAGLHFWAGNILEESQKSHYEAELLKTCAGYSRIGITDEHLSEQIFLEEFLWFRDFLEKNGKTVFLAEAETVCMEDGEISLIPWKGITPLPPLQGGLTEQERKRETVDFLFNRFPFSDFLKIPERFAEIGEVEKQAPQQISTTVREWLYSEKLSLLLLQKDSELADYIPQTLPSWESVYSTEVKQKMSGKIVAKPVFSYGGKGVFLRPSHPILQKILDEKTPYLFQEFCAPPTLSDGRKYDIRLLAINGNISAVIARVYSGAITNFKNEGSGICGVGVVNSSCVKPPYPDTLCVHSSILSRISEHC
ncbi:MAG: hypothetical protein WCJ84_01430 [Candidatus Peregrinibacteria bacterium]